MTTTAKRKSPALFYLAPDSRTENQVIGIDVAVDTFLDAFFRHTRHERFHCVPANAAAAEAFRQRLAKAGIDSARCTFVAPDDRAALADIATLFRLDPNINGLLAARSAAGHAHHAICGLSHTMSSMQVMGTVAVAVAQALQPWDAIVCPSRAIGDVVGALWEAASQGAPRPPASLPVIPLGIDTAHFARNAEPDRRTRQRAALGIGDDDVVVLFHGRLSYHNKAHPLPLLVAAERVAAKSARRIHVVFHGYFTAASFRPDYEAAAAEICRSARVHFVANGDPGFPHAFWAGADIFVSLVDNVQESFGLTPLEAMASGLPALVSDWDGYRDTVRHGEDGLLVPTLAPPPGSGETLVRRYLAGEDVYGEYLAGASQSIAVDIDATADALSRLVENPDLRRRMGAAGMRRAQTVFDWRHIVPAYEALWDELDARRARDDVRPPVAPHAITGPRELDPFRVFRGFPTRVLGDGDIVAGAPEAARTLASRLRHRMNRFVPEHLVAAGDLPRLVGQLRRPQTVAEIAARWPESDRSRLLLTLVWLVKLGVASHRPAGPAADG